MPNDKLERVDFIGLGAFLVIGLAVTAAAGKLCEAMSKQDENYRGRD